MRGRKPIPTAIKRLTGNPGHRPLNTHEPKHDELDETFDTPPPELAAFPRSTAEWLRLAPLLRKARQVSAGDRTGLIALCLEWGRYLEALDKVAAMGMVMRTPAGYPMTNPYLSIATKALSAVNKLLPELGLTPSSRSRVSTTGGVAADDPFAEFDVAPPDVRAAH